MKKNIKLLLFIFIFILHSYLAATKVEILAKINNQIITNIDLESRLNLAIEISNIPNEAKLYTLINDLSHGGWRTEQAPITNDDYKEICELVVKHIEEKFAHKYYSQIGLGIDFTARDIQEKCKRKGLPWEKSKGFDGSAQISNFFIDKSDLKMNDINFRLEKNGIIVRRIEV